MRSREDVMKTGFLTSLALAAALTAAPAFGQTLSIGTSPVGSSNHALGSAIGKVLGDVTGLNVRVVPYGGGQKILPTIDAGRFEMALLSASDVYFAYHGKGEFEKRATRNIRTVGVPLTYYLSWLVRTDSPYKTIADLKGQRVAVGYTANVAQRRSVLSQMAAAGLTEADFDGVQVPHVVRGADDLAQGTIVATSFAIGAGKVAEINARIDGGIRYLNFPTDEAALARMREFMPMADVTLLQPAPELVGVREPTHVQTEDYVLVVGKHVSDEIVGRVARMLVENQKELVAVNRQFGRYDPANIVLDRGVPYHDGAIAFFKANDMWPPKK